MTLVDIDVHEALCKAISGSDDEMAFEGFTEEELQAMPDRIADAFTDLTLLITGGTGFMGKVLVEKLLRKAPKVKKMILMVRPKKLKTPKQRIEEMLNDPVSNVVSLSGTRFLLDV
ncbi:Putative fatty acyl-CoA reductase CG5065 [Eumeta japonica]|uniref:Fatty acyl-CoA reductase n=1 Tax=Eumeta variegata TaxID=151549 RepID=A0A4C1ZF83_EUMVA|nr:Putative fatty acyl-CoA reductase CG5065 [Eumeta japonica]